MPQLVRHGILCAFVVAIVGVGNPLEGFAQSGEEAVHTRGRLWENLRNDLFIGSPGAWDYLTSAPLGMFPGFHGFVHPVGNEFNAVNTFANANMHNFRSGIWIVAKDIMAPGTPPNFTPTPTEYEVFQAAGSGGPYGLESQRPAIALDTNYIEHVDFNPLLPEESTAITLNSNMGITVTRRSYVWSFPGYDDFIIYDYTYKNTGRIVSNLTGSLVDDFPHQTLRDVYFVHLSGISVSTKSQINFHSELTAVQAGAFGWQPGAYHDYYHIDDDETLFYSRNYDGGYEPTPWNPFPVKSNFAWRAKFGHELMSPAAFGWLALHATPLNGSGERGSPRPDVIRIDSHKRSSFAGRDLDHEFFHLGARPKKDFFDLARTPDLQDQLGNNGNRMNFYLLTYGPYTLAPGDSVRVILAEIAGVMDYHAVNAGDPDGHFPDSTIAAIRRNAANARNAVSWGIGVEVNGIPLAADVPEPPPGPATDAVNASFGTDDPVIAVTWDTVAETASITDGSGSVFYSGLDDLDGYRVYRSQDFQYTSDTTPPALRGAAWTLLADIPKENFGQYWDPELARYRYADTDVTFGRRYGYYVSAYRNAPGPWISANGTAVNDLGPLESGSVNRTEPTSALPGPVASFDIYTVPNPFVFNQPGRSFGIDDPYRIEFRNMPERATVRIYSVSGDLVRTIEHGPDARGNLSGSAAWDQKSESGLLVAPGLYIYNVQSRTDGLDGNLTGKIMIVR